MDLAMSEKELDRALVLRNVRDGCIRKVKAAKHFGLIRTPGAKAAAESRN